MKNTQKRLLYSLLVSGALIVVFFTGALFHRHGIFPFPQLSLLRQSISSRYYSQMHDDIFSPTANQAEATNISIPVTYLPQYQITMDSNGSKELLNKKGENTISVPAHEVGFVLIDTWNNEDPKEGDEPSPFIKNIRDVLNRCRKHGVTIIHAPNHPVVDKYAQYHNLSETVQKFMTDYSTKPAKIPPFLDWPSRNNEIYKESQRLRAKGRSALYQANPVIKRDISRFLKPKEDEFVLASYNEFRYVLWKRQIKVLLYVGGALNECMLQRDTGINLLAGTDSRRVPITIIVLGDCSSALCSPDFDSETTRKVMLDYYKFKIAFVADSKELRFEKQKLSESQKNEAD